MSNEAIASESSSRISVMRAPLGAVLFDWAGTMVDYGSLAPARVFVEIFHRSGVAVTEAEARGPMGKAKREHIASVLFLPRVAALWKQVKGTEPTDKDVQKLYDEFLPLQKSVLSSMSAVIPGASQAVAWCRSRGLKIGSTTGYTRELMEVVMPVAKAGGYSPDVMFCSDDVPTGRPAPWLNFRAAEALGIYPMDRILIVDDTPLGIKAGRNAGCWTVAVSQTGNSLGLSEKEVHALPPKELATRLTQIQKEFLNAGAHHVIPSVADLPQLLQSYYRLPS